MTFLPVSRPPPHHPPPPSCGFQLMGPVNQVEGAKFTPCGVSKPPRETRWKHKTGNIFMNVTRRNKSLKIAYLYFSISKTTSYFVFSYEAYLTRYCYFSGGPLAQQGVYFSPSTWLTGPSTEKPLLFWPASQTFQQVYFKWCQELAFQQLEDYQLKVKKLLMMDKQENKIPC